MEAYQHISCVSIPESIISSDDQRKDCSNSIWWPCLLYPNYKTLINDLPSSSSAQRAKLFIHSLKNPKIPVASLLGAGNTDEIVTVPFPNETGIETMKKKHIVRDFIDWYYEEYDALEGYKGHPLFDRAVEKATRVIESSLSNVEYPIVTKTLLDCSIISTDCRSGEKPQSPRSFTTQDVHQARKEIEQNVANKKNEEETRIVTTNNKQYKKKPQKSNIAEMSHASSEHGRTWGEVGMSKNRISKKRTCPKSAPDNKLRKQRKDTEPKAKSSFITPHMQYIKPRSIDVPLPPSSSKASISSKQSVATAIENLPWKHLWVELKIRGWTVEKASNPLHDWYYIRPGYDSKKGKLGEHYFREAEDVMAYIKEEAEANKGRCKNSILEEMEQERVDYQLLASPTVRSASSESYYVMEFKEAYKLLLRLKFRYSCGKYVRPNTNLRGKDIKKGVDYFESVDELKEGLRENGLPSIDGLTRWETKMLNIWIQDRI